MNQCHAQNIMGALVGPIAAMNCMKAKNTSIVVLLIACVLGTCWVVNEDAAVKASRLNPPSHLEQVGLGFRGERNDIVGFRIKGNVVQSRPARNVVE